MKPKNTFRILVLEDSEFFNQLLTNQLKWYTGEVIYREDVNLEIHSYKTAEECLANLNEEVDLAFVDYYLDEGKTAMDVIGKIKEMNYDCRIFIISQTKEVKGHVALLNSIDFLYKDNYSLPRICFITEEIMKEKLRTIN
jgi:response regulator of citrate/malate metabolism